MPFPTGSTTGHTPTDARTGSAESPGYRRPEPVHDLVTAFLKNRDIPCPSCGYNLRDVTSSRCPECGTELTIHVHPRAPRRVAASAFGMFGIVLGLVLCVVATLAGLATRPIHAVTPVFLFVVGTVQLSLWPKYDRIVRFRRPDLAWVYTCSGWAIFAILVLWFLVR